MCHPATVVRLHVSSNTRSLVLQIPFTTHRWKNYQAQQKRATGETPYHVFPPCYLAPPCRRICSYGYQDYHAPPRSSMCTYIHVFTPSYMALDLFTPSPSSRWLLQTLHLSWP